ncbi:hypothetical protein RKD25_009087 [Streptomyces sp. SAI-124]|uniref:hypothetical protein n=1 Tax=Streptomyces sp. SAI-124 TaxID=3377730 RepID=UPI003C7E9B5A
MYNDTHEVLRDTGRRATPSVVREVDAVQEVMDSMEILDHIHTMAVYSLALQLAVYGRKAVQRSLDHAAPIRPPMYPDHGLHSMDEDLTTAGEAHLRLQPAPSPPR